MEKCNGFECLHSKSYCSVNQTQIGFYCKHKGICCSKARCENCEKRTKCKQKQSEQKLNQKGE